MGIRPRTSFTVPDRSLDGPTGQPRGNRQDGCTMIATWLESTGTLLTVLTPLVAVPLTVITFYLRSLREQQTSNQSHNSGRIEAIEKSTASMQQSLTALERDYATKEEWLRESTHARRAIEQLTETVIRIETAVFGTGCPKTFRHETRTRHDVDRSMDEPTQRNYDGTGS